MKPPEKKSVKKSVSMAKELWDFVDAEVARLGLGQVSPYLQKLVEAEMARRAKKK